MALQAEGPMGWSRETLSKDLMDCNDSAAICIVLFSI